MRLRPLTPAPVEMRAAHVVLFAAVAVPGLLLTATSIVSLALHRLTADVVLGVLTLAFAAWVVVGGLAAWLLVRRSERRTRLQHDFVSNVSHELRTPLTAIRMLVETLKLQRADPQQSERCLELLEAETGRLAALVEEVLDFGRLSAGVHAVTLAPEPVAEVVAAALDELEALRLAADLTVECHVADGLRVRADRRALGQVLVNLLSNAYKYGAEGKRISVRAALEAGQKVAIAVEDEGPGVPVTLRRKIFQEFFRGDDPVTRGKPGTGLGLAIAQRLVQAQGGAIRVEGRAGGGSRFVVTLPAADAEVAA